MKTVSYSEFRANLAKAMDEVWDDCEATLVTRKGGRSVVVLSKEEYEALDATAYLMRSPRNAEALRESLRQFEEGKIVHKTMEELEAMAG